MKLLGQGKSTFLQWIYNRIFATLAKGTVKANKLMWTPETLSVNGYAQTSYLYIGLHTFSGAFTYSISFIFIVSYRECCSHFTDKETET